MFAPNPTAYVCIGASAGGLEAIGDFFDRFPNELGCAVIVVQHLSPDHKSLMGELLARHTGMPVRQADDGDVVEANHVYLIPPRHNMTIFHGRLLLSEQDRTRGINLPIDVFLESLASDQAERAVAIIMSGTGSDGVRGLRAIKEHGGMVLVQDSGSARFDGMPKAAIETGLADLVAPPDELAASLVSFIGRADLIQQRPLVDTKDLPSTSLARIFAMLRDETGVDFTNYKASTVLRRIERRVLVNHLEDLDQYETLIVSKPEEARELCRELLIGVTRFFRDEPVWRHLRDQLLVEQLQGHDHGGEFRIWVAGCTTGEEAYTLAILITEAQLVAQTNLNIRIFATDLDQGAIAKAQVGVYHDSISADVPADVLAKYFQTTKDGLQVVRSIREMVIFATHNLLKDPPFTHVDLLSCRNVLIYFQANAQQQVMESFNFSLREGGLLVLGNSETIGGMTDRFEILDAQLKIYRCIDKQNSPLQRSLPSRRGRMIGGRVGLVQASRSEVTERVLERFFTGIAEEVLPVCILVNEQLEVLHILGDSSPYLRLPEGVPVNDVSRLAKADIHLPLITGVQRALRDRESLGFTSVRLVDHPDIQAVDLRIKPISGRSASESFAAIFISPSGQQADVMRQEGDVISHLRDDQQSQLTDLERELQFTRESLQATIEELETANEELQATNEELLSSNEELQSTNEELQSTNEELYTVNAEYQDKLHELAEANADLDNLLTTISTGVLILDSDMIIRRYSPLIKKVFGILDGDIGRPIDHLTHRLVDCDPVELARQVGESGKVLEREVVTETDLALLLRVAPFSVGNTAMLTGGVVVTFIDITTLRQLGRDIQQIEDDYLALFESINQAASYQSPDGTFVGCNKMASEFLGVRQEELVGRSVTDSNWQLIDRHGQPLAPRHLPSERARIDGEEVLNEVVGINRSDADETCWIEMTSMPISNADGSLQRVFNVWRDVSEHEAHRRSRERLLERMQFQSELTRTSWWEWHIGDDRITVSHQHLRWFGLADDATSRPTAFWDALAHPDDGAILNEGRERLLTSGQALVANYRISHADGHYIRCFHRARVVEYGADGLPLRAQGILGLLPNQLTCQLECQQTDDDS